MDIYTQTLTFLLKLPLAQQLPILAAILNRFTATRPHAWQLPATACHAVGGDVAQVVPAIAAIACLQASIILIDDMLDADPRGEYHRLGAPTTANIAAALQALGLEALDQSPAPSETKAAAVALVNRMALETAIGQHWDIQNPADEASYWRIVATKSAPFYRTALHVGALLGGATSEVADRVQQFGHLYGEMIQIHDDLNDTMETPASPDWTLGRASLLILFARSVAHPDQARFLDLCEHICDAAVLAEAQTILIQSGAVSYAIDQLLRRYWDAHAILETTPLVHRQGMEQLLADHINPVRQLFHALGLPEISRPNLSAAVPVQGAGSQMG